MSHQFRLLSLSLRGIKQKKRNFLFETLAILLLPIAARGAACCGGGFASPSLISGDDRAQISASMAYTRVAIDDIDSSGFWHKSEVHQISQTIRLEGAQLLSDRWQAGAAIPVVRRSRLEENHTGPGDIAVSSAYEYLTDWNYNPFRPKGIAYLQVTFPTGLSRFESERGGLDSRGNGLWAIGAGTLLTKAIGSLDLYTNLEAHRSLQKKISSSLIQGTLKPGWGGTVSVGSGWNTKQWRLGAALSWTYEDPVSVNGKFEIPGLLERYATGSLSTSYLASDEWSGTLSYSDQTLFGSPLHTSLGRTIAFQVQRKWGR